MPTPRPAVAPLALTGERTAPGIGHENYWFRRHEAVYAAVPGWVRGRPSLALDAGSGEGYGTAGLAHALAGCRVLGVDYDASAVAHARRAHGGGHVAYLRGALTSLPLPAAGVDLAVSLQVLEHIWTPHEMVRELVRVLAPGGTLVLSTPNRPTFSPGLGRREQPANAYHCREYDAEELVAELARWAPGLRVSSLLGVGHGPRLRAWEATHGSVVAAQQASAPEGWPPALARVVEAVRADDFELGPATDDSLDLVVVAHPTR
ncbi:MAG TPA: class I SAM-dependent methyltransferase [Pedococcus sp.]|jgi:SAM-dependent methyltransferase